MDIAHILSLWKPICEVLILWVIYYHLLVFIKDTRAFEVLRGLIVLAVLFIISHQLKLEVINWILSRLFAISIIALLVIFHPELRRGLARLGQSRFIGFFLRGEDVTTELIKAITILSKKKIGALLAVQREVSLQPFIESGIPVDAKITSELIATIFMPNTPLHDGGVIIEGARVAAASCLFPLTQNPNVSKTLGTRHRAGIGLSEESDALVIVVSEETGDISLAIDGRLYSGADEMRLKETLDKFYQVGQTKHSFFEVFNPQGITTRRIRT
ncbi:MAG: diadenylate cyclase CdaA [Candidatus Omnitrophica bacterium]|nr:diadenylate cyclase CdaA [Candidatus Omnitrophota bacterium]